MNQEDYKEKSFQIIKDLFSNLYFILLIGLIARIIVSFSLIGGLHADEQFQGLEMAYNLLYPSNKNIIPWEFSTQTRSYIIPLIFVPFVFLSSILKLNGLSFFTLLRFSLSLLSLSFIPLSKHLFTSETEFQIKSSIIVSWFFALYLPIIFFSNYLGADGFALLLLIFLMFYVSKDKGQTGSKRKSFITGLVISFLITFRLQFAIIFLPYLFGTFKKKQIITVYGIIIGFIPLLVTDFIFYSFPGITILNFFQFNVLNQKNVSLVPETYWWLYIVIVPLLLLYCGLVLPPIVFNYTIGYNKFKNTDLRLFALGSILYLLFFQYLTYKEIRFLIPAIVVILFDTFQSLPNFLAYTRKLSHRKLVKIYGIILLVSIPISFIIAPYNYDLRDNIWLAQEKVKSIDPNASIGFIDPFQMTGGYFFQYGGKTNGTLYFMNQMNSTELNKTFKTINFFISDQNHANYSYITHLKNNLCQTNFLIKDYTSIRQYSLDNINYQLNPNKLGVKIELWQCN